MQHDNLQLNVLVHVGYLIILGSNGDAIKAFKTYFCVYFHMKDLRRIKYFWEIEVAQSLTSIFL